VVVGGGIDGGSALASFVRSVLCVLVMFSRIIIIEERELRLKSPTLLFSQSN